MATALYDTGRNAFLNGAINWNVDNIKACLVHNSAGGTSYVPNLATDQFFNIIPSAAIVATGVQITTPSDAAGVANGAGVTFPSVSGVQVDAIVVYKDTGTPATSQLIAYIDAASGLPIVPNGTSIAITWDVGPSKIFKL